MDADGRLSSLRRRFVLISALNWLPIAMAMAVLIVLMDSRGLDLNVIGLILALYGLTTVVLELPTGGLADVISRRGVLAVSAGVGTVALAGAAFATAAWQFTILYMLFGVARALSSGPAEAWYVDSVKAVRADADIRKGLAAASVAGAIALGSGTIIGGSLALLPIFPESGPVTAVSAPMLLAALLNLVLLVTVVVGMRESTRPRTRVRLRAVVADVPRTVGSGIALGVRNRVLARLLLTVFPVGVALTSVELLTPRRLLDLTGDSGTSAGVYGVIAAIGFASHAVGASLSSPLASLSGGAVRGVVAGTLVTMLGPVSLFATGGMEGTASVVATAGGYALMFLGLGLNGPLHSELTHHQVESKQRATVVSIKSLVMQGGGSLSNVTLPLLAGAWSIPGAWLVAGLLVGASAVLYIGIYRPAERPPDHGPEQDEPASEPSDRTDAELQLPRSGR